MDFQKYLLWKQSKLILINLDVNVVNMSNLALNDLWWLLQTFISGGDVESNDQMDGLSKSAYERRIQRLEDDKKELLRKLADSNRALQNFAHGPPLKVESNNDNDNEKNTDNAANEMRKLQDDNNMLVKKNNGKDLDLYLAFFMYDISPESCFS